MISSSIISVKSLFLIALTALVTFIPGKSFCQKKKLLQEYDHVVSQAKAELDSLMAPGTVFLQQAAKQNIKGEYILDITVHDKGQVLSVFMVSSDADDIKMQNRAKDLVRTIVFGFKVPRDKSYKFQYTFQFK
ncbi:MAG: hypothetical protein JNL47_11765 [Bacteroidia bacterium]|nr:hypothetical protein [Bacteroidia bacterium]